MGPITRGRHCRFRERIQLSMGDHRPGYGWTNRSNWVRGRRRECDVLEESADGFTSVAIASQMDISKNLLRVLAQLENSHIADIDTVAVHRLNLSRNKSNSTSSWTSENRKMWLQDNNSCTFSLFILARVASGINGGIGWHLNHSSPCLWGCSPLQVGLLK